MEDENLDKKDIKLLHKIMISTNENTIPYELKELFCGYKYGRLNNTYTNNFIKIFKNEDINYIREEIRKIMRDEEAIDEDWAFPNIVKEAMKCRSRSIQNIKNKIINLVMNNNEIYIKFNANSFIICCLHDIDLNKAKSFKNNLIYKELIEKTWHPNRVKEWCLSTDELEEFNNSNE